MVGLIPSGLARSRGFYPYKIDYALRLNAADSPGLSRTPGSAGDRKTWEVAVRVKVTEFGSVRAVYAAGTVAGGDRVWFDGSDKLNVAINGTTYLTSSGLFRDPSSHYAAIRVIVDTTQATAADRITVEVNDAEITAWDTDNRGSLSQNTDCATHSTVTHYWGRDANGNHFDGYFSEAALVDGGPLSGYVSTKDGTATPNLPNATWGMNGALLDFADAANLGKDVSGNGNDFTTNNITSDDQVEDTPTRNTATLNPLRIGASSGAFKEAARELQTSGGGREAANPTFAVSRGKWYVEFDNTDVGGDKYFVGIVDAATNYDSTTAKLQESGWYGWGNDDRYEDGVATANGVIPTLTTQRVGLELDADNGTLTLYINGTQEDQITGLPDHFWYFNAEDVSNSTAIANIVFNVEPTDWQRTPTAGFKPLNAANLFEKAYRTSGSYTGNGSSDGPFVYTGAAFSEVTIDGTTYTNDGSARGTVDFLANGFKLRSTTKNGNGTTYAWSGVVSQDFKYANAQVN